MKSKSCVTLLLMLLADPLCFAQTNNQGAIVGTVTDPSGAVIPGVRITVVAVDTGVARTAKTDRAGDYRVEFLEPARYEVKGEKEGFKKIVVTSLSLTVGQVLRVDERMPLGATTQAVTVVASTAPLDVDTPALGNVIPNQAIQNLPLNGREFIQLASLVAGAESGSPKRGTAYSKGYAVGFNGARASYNGYFVDGADSTDPLYNTLISSPALDAIKEFRVETNLYSVQYGRSGGAIISVVTNSGTNTIHGTLYEYHRNKALDARPAFATQPKSDLPNYLFNQFGGTVGGPIKKDKAFFFFSMEKFRQKSPGQLMVSFAPTARERAGDVSQTVNPYTGQPVVLKNPSTGEVISSGVLPQALINPVGQTLMDIWSQYTPNYNDPFLNLRFFRGSKNTQNKYLPRVDYNFNERNVVFGTFDFGDYDNGSVWHTIYGAKTYKEHDRSMSLTYTHTFAPNLVNDFKFSRTWYLQFSQFTLRDQSYGIKWGMYPGINMSKGSPRILMYTIGYQRFDLGNDGDYGHNDRTLYLKDSLAWMKGKHTVFIGGDFRRQAYNWAYDSGESQNYFGLLDGYPGYDDYYGVTGSVFTDLLAGLPNLLAVGVGTGGLMPFRRNAFSAYLQDGWKVSSRLTLNVGLRYDYEAPFSVSNGQFMGLDFSTGLPRYCAGAPTDKLSILTFDYEIGGPCRDHNPDYRDFAPRIGFAYRPFADSKTVVRGGYGIFYNSENAFNTTYGGWVLPFAGLFNTYPKRFFWPPYTTDHFWTLDQKPYQLEVAEGKSMGFFYPTVPHYPTGYVEQYNLSGGRDLPGRMALELGWVGARGVNLNGPSTVFNYDPTLVGKISKANPQFGDFGVRVKGFNSYYNALQASLRKEMSNGLYFLASYTWGHAQADSSNDDTNENLFTDRNIAGNIIRRRKSNADFDVRQRFSFSGIWTLPMGRGKTYGSNWNGVADGFLGGWQFNTIIAFQGGYPFTVYNSSLYFPDRVCDGNLHGAQRTPDHWFDYHCFVTHTPTTVTDPVTGLTEQINIQGNSPPNVIFGPGTNNWDVGIEKNFRLSERFNLQFRSEFFNAFNHPNYQGPGGNYFFNSTSGAQITRAGSQRDIQLALRLGF